MASAQDQTDQADRAWPQRLTGVFFAVVVILTPLVMASWFALCPQYGDPACPGTAHPQNYFPAVRAAASGWLQLFLLVNLLVPYLFPLGYLGLARVSWRSAPVLTTIGLAGGWLASIAWGFIADEIFTWTHMAQAGNDSTFAALLKQVVADWHIFIVVGGGWVLGHLLAYVLLGIGLLKTPGFPRWAGILIIVAAPLMGPLAYGLQQNWLQIGGFFLVAIGSLPAARLLLSKSHA